MIITKLPRLSTVNHEPSGPMIPRVVRLLSGALMIFTHRRWQTMEKIPPAGGVVLVANHISNVDPIVMGQYVAYSGRWPHFLAKVRLFSVPVVGWVLKGCEQIPVMRATKAAADALDKAVAAIEAGRAVVVYPEGTITLDPDLWPMVGKTGAARIALRTGCPVIPIGQWGAQEIMYGKRIHAPKLLPRKTLQVITGDPVPLDDLRALPITTETLAEATDRMINALTALVAGLRQEPPPAVRFNPRLRLVTDGGGTDGGGTDGGGTDSGGTDSGGTDDDHYSKDQGGPA